jgi:hypothetical protein
LSSHPGLPCCRRGDEQEGPCAPRACPRCSAPTAPAAPLASSGDCPGVLVLRPPWRRRCPGGRRRAAPVAERVLVPRPSRPPRPRGPPRPPVCGGPGGRRLAGGRLGLWGGSRAGPPVRARALPPGHAPPSRRWGGRAASAGWCPVRLRSELQGAGFSPGRLSSYCTRQPFLDTHPDVPISRIRFLGSHQLAPLAHPTGVTPFGASLCWPWPC